MPNLAGLRIQSCIMCVYVHVYVCVGYTFVSKYLCMCIECVYAFVHNIHICIYKNTHTFVCIYTFCMHACIHACLRSTENSESNCYIVYVHSSHTSYICCLRLFWVNVCVCARYVYVCNTCVTYLEHMHTRSQIHGGAHTCI